MQIHVVRPGQTIFQVAQTFGSSAQAIAEANGISPESTLVVGQALVIPIVGQYYWVQPGDSLYSIARRFGIPLHRLAEVNRLASNAELAVGTRLYIPPAGRRSAEFNAYIEPRAEELSPSLTQSLNEAIPHLTYLAPFSFRIRRDGSLQAPPLDNLREIASRHNVTLMMVVTNIENEQFSADLGAAILGSDQLQNTLLNHIIRTARELGFRDIHFDIEHLRPQDREEYNGFLRKAADRLHREGFLMSTALAPKTSAAQTGEWYTAHDYKTHGEVADFVVIMTYEWGYSGGPAMPVSPIGPVRRVLEYARTEIPANKIMMGQNLYGYDWTLPFVKGTVARAISPQAAINLARRYNQEILYDYTAQAPHFGYRDEEGREHTVWFEDARSIQAKFNLVKELDLRGVSYWKLGLSFPQNWLLIENDFTVAKR
ncbi:glycoside hydrolase family 18 protein [Paenibacillus hamazuiensis]|uniref:glycoside hydrolase family 18 protein n=1 Tax=Paenibacillus hamazuiensis TaxID=2936508 RepID=UPI00200CA860|nr:glycoside hydrolase family 18 protein [Paenibacillus hamazuiensis]